jgi:GH15 family glucan-1,4-alpha-glucosidase
VKPVPDDGWIDVSVPIREGMVHWPDDPPVRIEQLSRSFGRISRRPASASCSRRLIGAGHQGARINGYAPIRDYAAIGDGRTAALVARDCSIDWLCLPDLDSPSVFAALLDAARGGRFELRSRIPYEARRRYLPDTNVLETTLETASGTVRVTDAMLLPSSGLSPGRELVRKIEGLSGRVPMQWRVEPRFGFAAKSMRFERRLGVPVISAGRAAIAICSWQAGEPRIDRDTISGEFEAAEGTEALVVLSAAEQEPLVLPSRDQVETRLAETVRFWRDWLGRRTYDGPWRQAVLRSALALKLLVFAPSGAIAAAATSSLPEVIGGERNWDYRFSWLRDSAFTLDAFLQLGCPAEAKAFFWWLMHASQLTHPRLHVLYRLAGQPCRFERELDFDGYRHSTPARVGNAAAQQRQLDVYGELLQTAWLFSRVDPLDPDIGRRLAELGDYVCRAWREPDSGIWEVRSEPVHFTQSKMMCWATLDRALALADEGQVPDRSAARWRREADAIREFIERRCWSEEKQSYVRFAGTDELDASLLLAVLVGYRSVEDQRLKRTVEAIRRELGRGPFLYRYTGEDGLQGSEGFFLACSFWLVDALARCGRSEEAAELMEELVAAANDVGLYAEEIEPSTGEFLGNFPQGLAHLALINAAVSVGDRQAR